MPSVEDVQRHLTDNINAITWAGLEVRERRTILKLLKNEPKKKRTKAAKFSGKKKRLLQNIC